MKKILTGLIAVNLMIGAASIHAMDAKQPAQLVNRSPIELSISNQSNQIVSLFSYEMHSHNSRAVVGALALKEENDYQNMLNINGGIFLATSQGPHVVEYILNRQGQRVIYLWKLFSINSGINLIAISNIPNPSRILIIINPDGTVQMADRSNIE